MLSADEIKTLVDIGLGAISLMLWFRQGGVNKMHGQAVENLTKMVKSHEDRLDLLEAIPIAKLARRARRKARG